MCMIHIDNITCTRRILEQLIPFTKPSYHLKQSAHFYVMGRLIIRLCRAICCSGYVVSMIYLTSSNGYWIRDFDCERVINMVITEKAVFPMGKLSSQRAICCSFLMPTAWASCSCRSCHFESVWTAVLLQCALLRTVITVMLMVRVPDVRMAPSSITATVKVRWIFWKYKYSLDIIRVPHLITPSDSPNQFF